MAFNFFKRKSSEQNFVQAEGVAYDNSEQAVETVEGAATHETLSDFERVDYEERDDSLPLMLEKFSKRILEGVVFLLPLFVLPFTFEAIEFPKQILFTFGLGASTIFWIASAVMRERANFRFSKFFLLPLLFLASQVLAVVLSLNPNRSIFGQPGGISESLLTVVNGVLLFYLVSSIYKREDLRSLIKVLSASLVLTMLFGVLRLFGVDLLGKFAARGIVTSVGSANTLGILGALLVLLSFSSKEFFSSYFWRSVSILGGVLGFIFLVILDWWILYAILLVGLVIRFILSGGAGVRKFSDFVFPVALILVTVFAWLVPVSASLRSQLPLEVALSYKTSARITKGVILEGPFKATSGVGQENFAIAFDKYKTESINTSVFWNVRFIEATSEAFNMVINSGILGLLTFFVLLVGFVWTTFRGGMDKEKVALASMFGSLVGGFFLYPFPITPWVIMWFVMGLLVLCSSIPAREFNFSSSQKIMMSMSAVSVGLILFVAVEFFFLVNIVRADALFRQAIRTSDVDESTRLLTEAYNLNSKEDIYARAISQRSIALLNREINRQDVKQEEKLQRVQSFLATSINFSAQLTNNHSEDAQNWISRASVYQNALGLVGGVDQFAIQFYQEAEKRAPKDPIIPARIGQVHLFLAEQARQLYRSNQTQEIQKRFQDNLELAEDAFKRSIALKQDFALALYNLGVVYERQGKVSESIRQLEQSALLDNQNPGLMFELGLLYYRNNQKNNAFSALQRAVSLFDNYSNARWFLALLHEERGELDAALDELSKILVSNPENPTVMQKIELLNQGKREIPPQRITDKQPLQ